MSIYEPNQVIETKQKIVKPRTRRYKRTRQAIVLAAQRIIAEQGTDGLSMRMLAEQIDYSPAGLYEYFDGKEEIIQAVRLEGLQRFQLHLQQTVSVHCPVDAIKRFSALYVEFAQHNPSYFHLIFSYDLQTNGAKSPIDLASLMGSLLSLIQKGINDKIFQLPTGFTEQEMAYAIWSLVHGFATLRIAKAAQVSTALDAAESTILHAFLHTFSDKEVEKHSTRP